MASYPPPQSPRIILTSALLIDLCSFLEKVWTRSTLCNGAVLDSRFPFGIVNILIVGVVPTSRFHIAATLPMTSGLIMVLVHMM